MDKADQVAKYNAQVRHFNFHLLQVDTLRTDARGSFEVDMLYHLEETLLRRAAQSWLLAHPPAPEYASIKEPPVYAPFCASRLLHQQCANLDVSWILAVPALGAFHSGCN